MPSTARSRQRLAQHVVRGRRQRRPRRAAQDPFAAVAADHVGDVGVAVADRLGVDLAAPEAVLVEERLERPAHEQRRPFERRRLLCSVDDHVGDARTLGTATTEAPRGLQRNEPALPATAGAPPLMRRILLILPLLAALCWPAAASASARQFVTFEAPRELLSASTRDATLDQITSFGVTHVRQLVYWRDYAPDPVEPHEAGASTRAIPPPIRPTAGPSSTGSSPPRASAGSRVTLTLTGPVPRWATRDKRDDLSYPDAKEFGAFATAIGRRYGDDGEHVVDLERAQPAAVPQAAVPQRQAVLAEALSQALPGGLRRAALDAGQRAGHDPDRRDLAARQRRTSSARWRSCAGCCAWTRSGASRSRAARSRPTATPTTPTRPAPARASSRRRPTT